jgi:hypothetical protein
MAYHGEYHGNIMKNVPISYDFGMEWDIMGV